MSYVPLRLRSNYSLLAGTAPIERLIDRAQRFGIGAMALTDTNNLYGAVEFYCQSRAAGIKPILGAEITSAGEQATLLARDRAGYANLCRIITERNLDESFVLADALAAHQDGLFILTETLSLVEKLYGKVDSTFFWLDLVRPGRGSQQNYLLRDCAYRYELDVVATGDVTFLDSQDYGLHRVLAAMRDNNLVSQIDAKQTTSTDAWFASPQKMAQRYQEFPDLLANTRKIAAACNLELSLGKPIFPKYPLDTGESSATQLARECQTGLMKRYGSVSTAARERMQHELAIINQLGFAEYFLVVWDIVRFARSRSIPVVGRGSGASSIVAYLLGITSVDPLTYNLPFERFLNVARTDCPDLDIDFCWKQRDEVIDYVYRTYGADRVAMISTHNTLQRRGAFREVAKAFGLASDQITAIGRRYAHDDRPLTEALRVDGQSLPVPSHTLSAIASYTEQVIGFPHHLSIHCGGIVIGDRPLTHYVPLERAPKGIVITQFEMNAVEQIGLVKIDLLGNRALSVIRDTVTLLAEQQDTFVDPEQLPDKDAATLQRIQTAQTIGCCQLESPAMRRLITMLRPESIMRIIQALALIRPAPSAIGMQAAFIRRARGWEETTFMHPSLETVLGDTFGILLYEDDAMLVASCVAGLSFEEGDRFRKSIKKSKTKEDFLANWDFFRSRARQNGVPNELSKKIWIQMAKFNEYSFCRAHAAGYGLVAYQNAYLKTHYPVAYMTAAMNNLQGLYPRRVHISEAQRMGLVILLPCVNRSEVEYTLEEEGIRIGFAQIKGLTEKTMDAILRQQQQRPFESVADFLSRLRCTLSELESLILAGGFDDTGYNRAELLWQAHGHFGKIKAQPAGDMLLSCPPLPTCPPPLPDHSLAQKVAYELEILECPVSAHPVALVRRELDLKGPETSARLAFISINPCVCWASRLPPAPSPPGTIKTCALSPSKTKPASLKPASSPTPTTASAPTSTASAPTSSAAKSNPNTTA